MWDLFLGLFDHCVLVSHKVNQALTGLLGKHLSLTQDTIVTVFLLDLLVDTIKKKHID